MIYNDSVIKKPANAGVDLDNCLLELVLLIYKSILQSKGAYFKMENKKYYLGLDIGTDSVGFCVTDQNYNIIKKHREVHDGSNVKYYGNHLWGSRLFDSANDASERRAARENRRRLQRRKWRIVLLQDLFKEEMNKVDPYFFDRLNNSAIHLEDRDEVLRKDNLLFNDDNYKDGDFYKNYPTIYHLRKEMLEHPEHKFDIREIYLALAHMIKYRGNFLQEGKIDKIGNDPDTIVGIFDLINGSIKDLQQEDDNVKYETFNCDNEKAQQLIDLFKKENKSGELFDKTIEIFKANGIKKTSFKKLAFDLMLGKKVKVSSLFSDLEESDELKIDIDFSSEEFETKVLPSVSSLIGEARTQIILSLKQLNDLRILANLLKGNKYISESMVEIYDTHKEQLRILKELVKKYNPDEYNRFFKCLTDGKNTLNNYANYVGYNKVGKRVERVKKSTNQEVLYKEIKKILPIEQSLKDDFVPLAEGDKKKLIDIKNAIDSNKYLLKQNSKENGVLPYQLNLIEMHQILQNQSKYYSFLGDKDKDFNNPDEYTYKIESILKFKIPYFVGPLTDKAKHSWIVRNDGHDEKITPWNFHDVINEDMTAEKFMENLKNCCTYLIDEPTLPKCSLLNQMFVLLNEINKWRLCVNGASDAQFISVEDKEYIIREVYLKNKPTLKTVKDAFKRKYGVKIDIFTGDSNDLKELSAADMHASLSSWIIMMNDAAFGESLLTDKSKQELADEIINEITTFENKELVQKRLKKHKLTPAQIKYLSNIKFEGWARLSRKLLNGLYVDKTNINTGEVIQLSIMDLMLQTNDNFMQILTTKNSDGSYKYSFMDQIEEEIGDLNTNMDDVIASTYTSPVMKRALYQTVKIVNELKEILKIDHFDSYFIESTREEREKKRSVSRKDLIVETLKTAKNGLFEDIDLEHLKNEASLKQENDFRDKNKGKKMYLYFMQLGKSVYSGENIDLNNLQDYDIDHIIPQAKVKDDSFINTVLVERSINNKKSDNYPIKREIITKKAVNFIKALASKFPEFMPKEKINRILRSENKPLSADEISGFINRQLVTTNQSVKAVCDVLKKVDGEKSKIIYSKAGLVSEFRRVFNIPKSRDVNNFHHAHDAYLNVVVGNVFYKRFSNGNPNAIKYMMEHLEQTNVSVEHVFKHDQYILMSDTQIWKAKKYIDSKTGVMTYKGDVEDENSTGTIDLVRKYLSYNDPLVTHMLYEQVGKQGLFNKVHIHPTHDADASFPLKMKAPFNNPGFESKYGGYSDLSNPYVSLVKSDGKKGKHNYSIEFIPKIIRVGLKNDKEKLEDYLTKTRKLKNPEILIEKLLMETILEIPCKDNNCTKFVKLRIKGKTGNCNLSCINNVELFMPIEYVKIIKKISKLLGKNNQAGKEKVNLSTFDNYGKGDIDTLNIKITRDEIIKLFDYITNVVYSKPEYNCLPSLGNLFIKIKDSKEKFYNLSSKECVIVLSTMIDLLSCKSVQGRDLSVLGLAKSCGIIAPNQNLSPKSRIVQTSTTGFKEFVLFTVPED